MPDTSKLMAILRLKSLWRYVHAFSESLRALRRSETLRWHDGLSVALNVDKAIRNWSRIECFIVVWRALSDNWHAIRSWWLRWASICMRSSLGRFNKVMGVLGRREPRRHPTLFIHYRPVLWLPLHFFRITHEVHYSKSRSWSMTTRLII